MPTRTNSIDIQREFQNYIQNTMALSRIMQEKAERQRILGEQERQRGDQVRFGNTLRSNLGMRFGAAGSDPRLPAGLRPVQQPSIWEAHQRTYAADPMNYMTQTGNVMPPQAPAPPEPAKPIYTTRNPEYDFYETSLGQEPRLISKGVTKPDKPDKPDKPVKRHEYIWRGQKKYQVKTVDGEPDWETAELVPEKEEDDDLLKMLGIEEDGESAEEAEARYAVPGTDQEMTAAEIQKAYYPDMTLEEVQQKLAAMGIKGE